MIYRLASLAIAGSLALVGAVADARWSPSHKLGQITCGIGPAKHIIAGQAWYLYACDDGASIGFVSSKEKPGAGWQIVVLQDEGRVEVSIYGEGKAIDPSAAYRWARKLTPKQVSELYLKANSANKNPA